MVNVITEASRQLWDWVVGIILAIVDAVLGTLLDTLPHPNMSAISGMLYYLRVANAWLPLDVLIGALGAYFALVLGLAAFRWVKSFIPGLSN